jgi:hypothetical protein
MLHAGMSRDNPLEHALGTLRLLQSYKYQRIVYPAQPAEAPQLCDRLPEDRSRTDTPPRVRY